MGIDALYRRFIATQALIGDFLLTEAQSQAIPSSSLQRILRDQARVFDRLLVAIGKEHAREERRLRRGQSHQHAERIERLLAGEFPDTAEIAYEFEGHHLGLVAAGEGAERLIGELAAELDRRLLILQRPEGMLWAWLGGRRAPEMGRLKSWLAERQMPSPAFTR